MIEIDTRDANGKVTSTRKVSVAQYFKETYNIHCKRGLPVVELTDRTVVPIEVLTLLPNQRYRTKLDDKQTSNMIKFAVTLPKERWAAVQHGLQMLDWPNDPYLQAYGMKISTAPSQVKGRILPTPEPTFNGSKVTARDAGQGRWRIDGKKFITQNPRPLKAWAFCIVDSGRGPCVSQQQAQHFSTRFVQVARTHGMQVPNEPLVLAVKTARGGEMISDAWNACGNKYQTKPNMLFFVVPSKDADLYRRIKKSCECRYGVVSQVLQSSHVMKAQDQYISNVCMKVNAKLGGATCVATGGLARLNPNFGKVPTMIIGADVSHAAPGDDTSGSMAALTMSLDRQFLRYAAQCETNGHRVEIITTSIIQTKLKAMVEQWSKMYAGHTPQQVIYFRDGVSEGQFQFVLNQEVADMKEMFKEINPKVVPKFTVIICGKRHHVRFFPGRNGDRNENPVPGTLVETGVTHPRELDFYLASHSAIKGTARPVHYNVIANENNYDIQFIEQLTFEHCMQYMRSTTPVSMVPPVYYAHLASNRAAAHKNESSHSSGKKESVVGKDPQTLSTSEKADIVIAPLIPLNNSMGILSSMWYI
jgi:eukaryotic translation initiation factor 2C